MEKNARAIIRRTDHAVYVKNETKKKKKKNIFFVCLFVIFRFDSFPTNDVSPFSLFLGFYDSFFSSHLKIVGQSCHVNTSNIH